MAAPQLSTTMRAARWTSSTGGIEKHMHVSNIPSPTSPPKDSTVIKVTYATLNPVDYKFAETPLIGRFITRTPGSDFSGEVVSSSHTDLQPGDAVFGIIDPPSFRRTCGNVAPLPESVKPRDAAALGVVALTAYQAIVPFVKAGDRVLVNGGSGGVGTFAIQIAKAFGCYVSVTCSGANAELCRNLGADDIIDYRTVSPVEALQQRGTQYALILDAVGTPALYYSAHHYLAPDGVFNTIAIDPTSFASIRQTALMFLLPRFLWGGRRKINFIGAKADSEVFARLARMMKEGRIRTLVEQEYALEQVGEAFARLKTGRTRGKIIVRVSQ